MTPPSTPGSTVTKVKHVVMPVFFRSEADRKEAERLKEEMDTVNALLEQQKAETKDKLAAAEKILKDMKNALEDSGLSVQEILKSFSDGTGDDDMSNMPFLMNLAPGRNALMCV
jgi:hypothetical protein